MRHGLGNSSPDPQRVDALRDLAKREGWSGVPNMHFGHMQRGYVHTASELGLEEYLTFWQQEIGATGAVPREQWESYWFFWLDLERPSPDSIELLGELFGFHPLALEDSRHFGQRPKLDDYEDHMFLVYYGARARRRDAGRGTRIPQRQLHHYPFTSVPFDCIAALVPEPSNPYDSNAVMVQIDGRHVGYLSREDAVAFCFRVKLGVSG